MNDKKFNQPLGGNEMPRFGGIATMMRLPHVPTAAGLDVGAVIEDHGRWNDYSDYMCTYKYVRMNRLQLLTFPLIAVLSNRNISNLFLIDCSNINFVF